MTNSETTKTLTVRQNSFAEILLYIYFALTFFEPYLNGALGSITKYYILFVMLVIVAKNGFKICLQSFVVPIVVWLAYLFLSLLWTKNYAVFRMHVFSQIGMVGFLIVLTSVSWRKEVMDNIVKIMWASSFVISLLAVFFSKSYLGTVEVRQVLVLFGQETDPNNQAAFALVGIAISLYYLMYKGKYFVFSAAILFVNLLSMFLTASRGGLISLLTLLVFILVFNTDTGSAIKKLLLLACACFAAIYVIKRFLPADIAKRLFDYESYEDGSGRADIWKQAFALLKEDLNLLFGTGWGAYKGYGLDNGVHNTFFAFLCDVGIVGFLLFFVPIIRKAHWCIKKKEYLPILLLIAGFTPSFFIDAINKRIFWSPIMFLFMFYLQERDNQGTLKEESR